MSPEIEVMEILCLRVGEGVVGSRGGVPLFLMLFQY